MTIACLHRFYSFKGFFRPTDFIGFSDPNPIGLFLDGGDYVNKPGVAVWARPKLKFQIKRSSTHSVNLYISFFAVRWTRPHASLPGVFFGAGPCGSASCPVRGLSSTTPRNAYGTLSTTKHNESPGVSISDVPKIPIKASARGPK
jgi:hypothetical protein